jgi:hypothetical protein
VICGRVPTAEAVQQLGAYALLDAKALKLTPPPAQLRAARCRSQLAGWTPARPM